MNTVDVVIIGDGIVARTLSKACEVLNISNVRIAPHEATYANDPRSYAIAPSSMQIFNALEVEIPKSNHVAAIEIGFGERFQEPLIALAHGKTMMTMVDHSELVAALQGGQHINAQADQFEFTPDAVVLPQQNIRASMIVIAEGKNSQIAKSLGVSYTNEPYDQLAITAKFRTERPHHQKARQLFTSFGPLGILPHETHDISIVWSQDQSRAQYLMNQSDTSFVHELEDKISELYGKLEMRSPRTSFPLTHSLPSRLYGERFVLAGDSAHAIHPLAGQGLNLGLRDVAVLAETLAKQKRLGLDLGAQTVLKDYADQRRGDISRLTHLTKALHAFGGKGGFVSSLVQKGLLSSQKLREMAANMADTQLEPQPALLCGKLP